MLLSYGWLPIPTLPVFHFVPTTPPQKPWEHPPSSAEIRIVEELYAVGEGAPMIRQQVLGVRLGLDVAEQLEDMGIYDAATMTSVDARHFTCLAYKQLRKEEAEAEAAADLAREQLLRKEEADAANTGAEASDAGRFDENSPKVLSLLFLSHAGVLVF